MGESGKTFTIKLEGKDVKNGKISLGLFVRTVNSIQKSVYNLGSVRLKGKSASPGRRPSIIQKECELFLLKAEPGSLSAQLALPNKEPDLAAEIPSFGENVLKDFETVLYSFAIKDPTIFKSVVPDPKCQKQIYNDITYLLPSEKDDYEFYYSFNIDRPLKKVYKPQLSEMGLYVDKVEDEGDFHDLEKVMVMAYATINQETEEISIKQIIEYERVEDLRPYRATKISHNNRNLLLSHEIACPVTKEYGRIIVSYEPLGIQAYAKSKEEAITEFKEEFIMLWDTYSSEDDHNLTQDAIQLKQKIKGLVEGEQLIGNT